MNLIIGIIFFILLFYIIYLKKFNYNISVKVQEKDKQILELQNDLKNKLNKARNIHEKMLPKKLPETKDILINEYYQPADYIGGDYYNVLEIDHGAMHSLFNQYLLYYFDVSGHGIDSSLLAIFINDAIENYFKLKHNPGELISPVDLMKFIETQYHKEEFPDDYMVCLFLGLLDLDSYELTYTSGGFQFPLFKLTPFKVEKIELSGLPISTAIDLNIIPRKENVIDINKDTSILFSTDGLLEEERNSQIYFDRLIKNIENFKGFPPPLIKDLIKVDFYDFTNGNIGIDDLTFLVLGRISGKEKVWELEPSDIGESINDIAEYIKNNNINYPKDKIIKILNGAIKLDSCGDLTIRLFNNKENIIMTMEESSGNINWKELIRKEDIKFRNIADIKLEKSEEIVCSYNNFFNKLYLVKIK